MRPQQSRKTFDPDRVVRRAQILRVAARINAASEAAASVRSIALLMPAASLLMDGPCRCPLCCRAA